jgi:hypothetical protein
MKRFIESEDRRQATLLPDSLEDYVTAENPVSTQAGPVADFLWRLLGAS